MTAKTQTAPTEQAADRPLSANQPTKHTTDKVTAASAGAALIALNPADARKPI